MTVRKQFPKYDDNIVQSSGYFHLVHLCHSKARHKQWYRSESIKVLGDTVRGEFERPEFLCPENDPFHLGNSGPYHSDFRSRRTLTASRSFGGRIATLTLQQPSLSATNFLMVVSCYADNCSSKSKILSRIISNKWNYCFMWNINRWSISCLRGVCPARARSKHHIYNIS